MAYIGSRHDLNLCPWQATVVMLLFIIACIVFYYLDIGRSVNDRDQFVRQVFSDIGIGETREGVLGSFRRHTRYRFLMETNTSDAWRFVPEIPRNSRTWFLVVEFQGDSVAAVKIRNGKGGNPRSAPADKTATDAR